MSDDNQQTKAELSSEELDTLERMLLESARKAGLPQQRSERGGNGAYAGPKALSGDGAELDGAAPRISLGGSTIGLPSGPDDDDAEPLSLRDLERVYEPGEPPPSLADTRPKSVPPPLPPARHPSTPAPALEARDGESAAETERTSDPPALPHRASAPPPPPHRASAPPPPPHRASAPPPPPHRASAPPPPPTLALEPEAFDANPVRGVTAETDRSALAPIDAKPLAPVGPGNDDEIEPGPDSARRDLQLLASVRPPPKGPDLEFDELMRIHVAPLAEDFPGASALPKDVLGPEAAAALTGGSVRPRPRAPLKSRPPSDDDAAAVSGAALKVVSASAEPIDGDLVPPSFRDLEPASARASTPDEGGAPKKKKKKKKPAAAPGLDSSIAPTSASLQPKVAVSPSGAPSGTPGKEAPTNRTPLYLAAAVVLLGGGYLIGKLGSNTQPTTAAQERPTTTPSAPAELAAPPETAKAPPPSVPAPTATATESAALGAGDPATTGLPVRPEAPLVATAAGTAASPGGPSYDNSATGPSPGASPAAPTTAVAATATATAPAPAETATTTPVTPPPAEAAFDKGAASAALASAAGQAGGCKQEGDPSGTARVQVTFVPSGRVTSANVQGPPYAGTATGGCIARAFRSASVPPFSGAAVTVSKTVSIP